MRYDYECIECGEIELREVSSEKRDDPSTCSDCGGAHTRLFPYQAAFGFMPFEEQHDEGLGCDLTGHRHRREVMAAQGVIEAGDPRKGARNFDKHAPEHVGRTAPKGIKYETRKENEDWAVGREDKNGTVTRVEAKDL